jgi:hypothetical protein
MRRTFLTDPGPPVETVIGPAIGRSEVRRLWKRRLKTGEEVSCVMFIDASLGEATLEITTLSAFSNQRLAEGIADGVLRGLEADEAKPMEEAEATAE